MSKLETNQPDETAVEPSPKLMVSSFIHVEPMGTDPVEVRRGMFVLTQDGIEVGTVAAVVMDCHCQEVTHILLGQMPPTAVYRLAPVKLLARVEENSIWLRVDSQAVADLPIKKSS
jgi:sporulation protein YlmC with PRC-barrel domain